MFDNIGRKIKTLAWVICWAGIAASIGGGITLFLISDGRDGLTIFLGFLVIIIGVLFSWIGSFFIYAYGQLVDKTETISAQLSALREDMKAGVQVKTTTEKEEELKKTQATLDAYRAAVSKMYSAQRPEDFACAATMFGQIRGYRDSNELAEKCRIAADHASMQAQQSGNV